LDSSRPLVIVNPRSGGGLSEAKWARVRGALAEGLGELDSTFTTAPRDATEIARREAAAGRRLILAFGGDGTISEVADGVLAAGAGATTEIGLIPRGTGGDFRRTLEVPHEIAAAAEHIKNAQARVVDAGRVRYRKFESEGGGEGVRHFVNVASFGFSSAVAARANQSSKTFGPKIAFVGATVRTLVGNQIVFEDVPPAITIQTSPTPPVPIPLPGSPVGPHQTIRISPAGVEVTSPVSIRLQVGTNTLLISPAGITLQVGSNVVNLTPQGVSVAGAEIDLAAVGQVVIAGTMVRINS